MTGFNIITAFAIILCARLGIRLYTQYKKMKREEKEDSSDKNESHQN